MLVSQKHFAMLEHGIYYYICTYKPNDHVAKGIVRFIKEIPETNVTERMNYHDVQKILDKSDKEVLKKYEKYIKDFELMAELATILKEKRMEQGYLNLDIPESKIELGDNSL